jgi:hypothetical protein
MSVVVAPIHRLLSDPIFQSCPNAILLFCTKANPQHNGDLWSRKSPAHPASCTSSGQAFLAFSKYGPSPPANTCSYIICRISNGSLDKKEDVDWSSVLCRDLRMLEDIPSIESKGGRGLVSARLRLRGRGSIAGSPLARLASSCISGGLRILDAKWSSYIRRVHMIGAMQIIIRNILYTSTRDFGLRHRKISVVLIATR